MRLKCRWQVAQLTESIDVTRAQHLEHANEALDTIRSNMVQSLMNLYKESQEMVGR